MPLRGVWQESLRRSCGSSGMTTRDKLEIVMYPRIAALIALLAASSLSAFAGEASGEFTVGKHPPIHPTAPSAFDTRDQRDPHKRALEVVLSEPPVDDAAAP